MSEENERAESQLAVESDADETPESGDDDASATEVDATEGSETAPSDNAEEGAVEEEAAEEPDDGYEWYVLHTYSGYEKKVKQSLQERVRAMGLEDSVDELLIPTEDVVEMKGGKKVVSAKKFFPGYLLVRMKLDDSLWHIVKNTPRVTGFVGAGRKPIPLSKEEVDSIVNRMEESVEAPKPKFRFSKGETVRIIDGPFTNFTGKVDEVDARRNTLKVMVSIFGRATPVELDFFQVEKV